MASFEKRNGKWRARARFEGSPVFLGYFDTEEEALRKECRYQEDLWYR